MAKSPLRATLLLGAVFLLGMACGAALFHLGRVSVHGHRPPLPGRGHGEAATHLSHNLDLEQDQAERLHEILESTHLKMRGIFEESRGEIRELLTPEQLEQFDKMHGMRKRRGGPRFGPPPEPPAEP